MSQHNLLHPGAQLHLFLLGLLLLPMTIKASSADSP
jgi:hypothetical protein